MLVLIVDDIEDNRVILNRIVQKLGFETRQFEDGTEVVAYCQNNNIDNVGCIFMDIRMPQMDGFTASKVIRELGYSKTLVAVTANRIGDDEEVGVFDAIEKKPISITIIQGHLDIKSA